MKKPSLVPLLVVAAALVVYSNSLTGPFIFDDLNSIVANPTIRHLWPVWQALMPPHSGGVTVEGRPIVNLSFAANYALGGTQAMGYHAVNLLIHILAALTLLGVICRTLLQPALREQFGTAALPLGLIAALFWTVHPLQTESVTYIVQRTELLAGLFYLFTLYCFIRGANSKTSGPWFILAVVACLLGMGSKEVMVSAPLMVLLYDRTFVAGSFRAAWLKRRWLYTGLAATWLLLIYLVAGTSGRSGTAGFQAGITWWQYALTQCGAVIRYLWLSVWPDPLVFDYGVTSVNHAAEVVPSALILGSLLIGTLIALRRWPALGFAGFWFFAILAPSSSVVPVATQTMAEHRMYLPLAAVIALAVTGVFELGKRMPSSQQFGRALGWAVLLLLSGLTMRRNGDYRSDLAIWQDTARKRPNNPRALLNAGNALLNAGELGEAGQQFEQALRVSPDIARLYDDSIFAKVHNNLGSVLAQEGKVEEAAGHFEQSVRIKPGVASARYNLGSALLQLGKVPEAMEQWEQAVRLNPNDAEAHRSLANVHFQAGRLQDAIEHLQQVVRIDPDDAEAHNNLGSSLARLGKSRDAIEEFEDTIRIKPDWAEAHCNLGNALLQVGRVPDAISHYEQAVRLNPDFTEAREKLARLRGVQ